MPVIPGRFSPDGISRAVFLVFTLTTSFLRAQTPAASPAALPAVAGPYRVATEKFVWTDTSRSDPTTSPAGDPRQLLVQLWYPSDGSGAAAPAPYVMELETLQPALAQDSSLPASGLAGVATGAILGGPIAKATARFPLVVFSHGLGTPRAFYTTYVLGLASAGYVVAAIDHPGMGVVALPDGRVVAPYAPWTQPLPGLRDRSEAEREAHWRPGRTQLSLDQRFVIDAVSRLAKTDSGSPLAGRIAMDRVAMAGHSDGFLSATCTDPRVRACINLAGVPALAERRGGLRRPLLTIHDASGSPPQTAIVATMRAPAWDLYLRGSNHNSVTDLGLFGPDEAGRAAAARQLAIIVAFSAAFLDQTLGDRPSPLMIPTRSPYPEAVLTWYGPPKPEN